MKFALPDKRILRFIFLFLALYAGWIFLYNLVIEPHGKLDELVINDSSLWSLWFLEKLGFKTFVGNNEVIRTIGIDGTHGLWIGDSCDGMNLFALFASFIIAFPSEKKRRARIGRFILVRDWFKLWYIPLGITVIHFANIFRIVGLCIVVKYHPAWLEFNHTYFFQLVMYVIIFFLWFVWIKKFSGKNNSPPADGKKEA